MVRPATDGILIAAVDGNGHGAEAAAAAKIAAATLEAFVRESPIALVLRCHEQLKGTRGAVMTLAFVHLRDRTLTWLGVGNVEAVLFRAARETSTAPDRALLRAGVVGYRLPPLRAEILPLKPFDTLIIATDGIKPGFDEGLTQQHGLFHGSVVASLVDVACGYAALSVMPDDREVLTVEFKIHFFWETRPLTHFE